MIHTSHIGGVLVDGAISPVFLRGVFNAEKLLL